MAILSAAVVSLVFPISAFALTPAADLTGGWSGFFQYNIHNNNDGSDCSVTGKVNAEIIQNGNQLDVKYKTTASASNDCWSDDNKRIFGTIDGSRITLNDPFYGELSGWFASSGIKLEAKTHYSYLPGSIPGPVITPGYDITFKTQLSPTNFVPPSFESKPAPVPKPEPEPAPEPESELKDDDIIENEIKEKFKDIAESQQSQNRLFDPNIRDNWKTVFDHEPPNFPALPKLGHVSSGSIFSYKYSIGEEKVWNLNDPNNQSLLLGDIVCNGGNILDGTKLVLDWGGAETLIGGGTCFMVGDTEELKKYGKGNPHFIYLIYGQIRLYKALDKETSVSTPKFHFKINEERLMQVTGTDIVIAHDKASGLTLVLIREGMVKIFDSTSQKVLEFGAGNALGVDNTGVILVDPFPDEQWDAWADKLTIPQRPKSESIVKTEPAQTSEHQVTISGAAFKPQAITIQVGETVTWINKDSVTYTVTSKMNENGYWEFNGPKTIFNSGHVKSGEQWSHTFNKPGVFKYWSINNMEGRAEVIVKEGLPKDVTPKIVKERVPNWIKNNAKWWSEGQIGDSDFTDGIQHLIKEKIIDIPDLPEQASGTAEEKVPGWIKNNAGWWADGQISEDDFVNGIKWLVENGIIRV